MLSFFLMGIVLISSCDLKVKRPKPNENSNIGGVVDSGRNLTQEERELSYRFCVALREKDLNVNVTLTQKNLRYIQKFVNCNGQSSRNILEVSIMSNLKIEPNGDTYQGFPNSEITHKSNDFSRTCKKILEDKNAVISNTDTLSKTQILRREFKRSGTGVLGSAQTGKQTTAGKFQIVEVKNYQVDTEGTTGIKGLVTNYEAINACDPNSKVKQSIYSLTFQSIK